MQLTLGTIALFATTVLGQTYCPESSIFRVKSVLNNATNLNSTSSSFGYVKSTSWYSSRYHAILDPGTEWTVARAYVTDIYNNTNSQLAFPDQDYAHSLGFTLNPLSKDTPADFAEINGADDPGYNSATEGVHYDDAGKIQYKGSYGKNVKWHGCPSRDLEWVSGVTQLGYRLHNATVPEGCYDIHLVIEYMDGWNTPTGLPPKCWEPRS